MKHFKNKKQAVKWVNHNALDYRAYPTSVKVRNSSGVEYWMTVHAHSVLQDAATEVVRVFRPKTQQFCEVSHV